MYVLAYVNGEGDVSHLLLEDKEVAEQYKQLFDNAVVMKVNEYEVIE